MKRVWISLLLVAGILLLAGYSSRRVESFAQEIGQQLEAAEDAARQGSLPAAHRAVLEGAALCGQMRRETALFLRTGDFTELEAALRAAGSYLACGALEEALGELSRAAVRLGELERLAGRWL